MKDISNNYIVIQGWMVSELGLSGNDLLCYALIFGFSQDDSSEFTGSLSYIQNWLNCSRSTAQLAIERLCSNNLIKKTTKNINGVTFNSYSISGGGTEIRSGVPNLIGRGYRNSGGGIPKFGTNNTIDNIDSNIIDSKKEKKIEKKEKELKEEKIETASSGDFLEKGTPLSGATPLEKGEDLFAGDLRVDNDISSVIIPKQKESLNLSSVSAKKRKDEDIKPLLDRAKEYRVAPGRLFSKKESGEDVELFGAKNSKGEFVYNFFLSKKEIDKSIEFFEKEVGEGYANQALEAAKEYYAEWLLAEANQLTSAVKSARKKESHGAMFSRNSWLSEKAIKKIREKNRGQKEESWSKKMLREHYGEDYGKIL